MGGNAKYKGARMRTATYEDTDGTRKAVTDTNGNVIRVGVGRQVGRTGRTNTTAANARERMLNAKAMEQVNDIVRQIHGFDKKWNGSVPLGDEVDEFMKDLDTATDNLEKLVKLANQIQPGTVDLKMYSTADATKAVEKVLGIKLHWS